jgi:hypothetical protein
MSDIIGYFEDEEQALAATRAARAAGFAIADVFTPYAVHGLDEAMGLPPSRLPWVCFVAGLAGGGFALGFQIWVSAVSWPLNVGGKPFASIPAFIPITFELTVLSAALSTALALLVRAKLYPGRRAVTLPRVTDDRFALVLATAGERGRAFLAQAGAAEVVVAEGGRS